MVAARYNLSLPELIKPNWSAPVNVTAYVSCRGGGGSRPPFDSFNVAQHVGDDPLVVERNRSRLPNNVNYQWLNQVHGNVCIELPLKESKLPAADACFTSKKNQVCAVMTADCLPILLCDEQGTRVAAIHAGWRGLANNIIEKTVAQMDCDSRVILAWLGPAISQENFEVGEEVKQAFGDYPSAFVTSPNSSQANKKYMADLYYIARQKLNALGITNVSGGEYCTYRQGSLFYSHRKSTHLGQQKTGRMVSAIYLT